MKDPNAASIFRLPDSPVLPKICKPSCRCFSKTGYTVSYTFNIAFLLIFCPMGDCDHSTNRENSHVSFGWMIQPSTELQMKISLEYFTAIVFVLYSFYFCCFVLVLHVNVGLFKHNAISFRKKELIQSASEKERLIFYLVWKVHKIQVCTWHTCHLKLDSLPSAFIF